MSKTYTATRDRVVAIPVGGATGEVLAKASGADYDTEWLTGGGGGTPTSRTISTTAPLTGGGDLTANRTLAIDAFTGDSGSGGAKGVVPAPGAGDAAKYLKGDGTWATVTGGSGLTQAEVLARGLGA